MARACVANADGEVHAYAAAPAAMEATVTAAMAKHGGRVAAVEDTLPSCTGCFPKSLCLTRTPTGSYVLRTWIRHSDIQCTLIQLLRNHRRS